jgi:hypothetical protein
VGARTARARPGGGSGRNERAGAAAPKRIGVKSFCECFFRDFEYESFDIFRLSRSRARTIPVIEKLSKSQSG